MAPSRSDTTPALLAGAASYVIWGLMPLVFQLLSRLSVPPWEILAHRSIWAAPVAVIMVLMARQGAEAWAALRNLRLVGWMAVSASMIAINWALYIWAVNDGRVLETSLGYYINPLLNMAAGALMFRERIDRIGQAAIALAAVGVLIQAAALGHPPVVSLVLAISFLGYGVVRKRAPVTAQTGLLVECLILAVPGLAYVAWLQSHVLGHAFDGPASFGWLAFCGPLTAIPLMLFSWSARRIPLSVLGFLQFIAPTMTFTLGILQGEAFSPMRGLSFAFIWGGVALFVLGAVRRSRAQAPVQSAA